MKVHRNSWKLPAAVIVLTLLVWGWTAKAAAHPELLEQIAALSRDIQARPNEARLYLSRGELYRQHREWVPALLDFETAVRHDPSLADAELAAAVTLREAGHVSSGRRLLDDFVTSYPKHAAGWLARARHRQAAGQPAQAAEDYGKAIELLPQPPPDLYLEHANAILSANLNGTHALAALEAGLERLGSVPALELKALELERRLGKNDEALARVDRLASSSSRKERFLAIRGEILEECGRNDLAHGAYREALQTLTKLSSRHLNTSATKSLKARLETAYDRTNQ